MRSTFALLVLLAPAEALAGGVAPLVMGGFHTERVYYYSREVDGGAGAPIADASDYEQYKMSQVIGNVGSGLELMLGDRDDLVQGVFRAYWMMDTPQMDPAKGSDLVDADALVANWRDKINHVGVGSIGIQWGFFRAAQDKFRLGISLHVGSGFITGNFEEFLLAQAGVNVNYQFTRTVEFFADIDYGLRARKNIMHGAYTTAGLRILFD